MDSGLYAAYTGLLARTQALDVAANNLANTGTNGFRAGRQSFGSMIADAVGADASQVGHAANQFGMLGANRVSDSQGLMTSTGNPLDLALEGSGYFTVQTSNGMRYTRDGSFRVSDAGVLTTSAGDPVLNTAGAPMMLPSGDVKVGDDGTISVSNASGSNVVGQLGIASLGPGGAVAAEGASLYRAADGVTPTASTATVRQGALEGSNEDAVHGTMQLMLMQRQAEMMQRALTVFHNDFDKTAAEELPRV